MSATVAGAGIAGLGAALALARAGWQVPVLERSSSFGEVGAGLGFTSNGMAAARALGIDEAVRAVGYSTPHAGYQDWRGRWILRIPPDNPKLRERTNLWGIHRQRLHAVLLEAAQGSDVELCTNVTVSSVRSGAPEGEPATVVSWEGGSEVERNCDLVVAADGVRSAVRGSLLPDVAVRYSGGTSWRAIIADDTLDAGLTEVWGPGIEFGVLRVSPSEIYWFGEFLHPEAANFDDELDAARQRFSDWPPWVRAIVATTGAHQLMRHDVFHLGVGCPTFTVGRVVLVGDAAHAMLPTIGQGAASALEDAVCVGSMIGAAARSGNELGEALIAFDRARRPRCQWLARQATYIARFGFEVGPGWRQAVRNRALRALPVGLALSAGKRVTRWTPPSDGSEGGSEGGSEIEM